MRVLLLLATAQARALDDLSNLEDAPEPECSICIGPDTSDCTDYCVKSGLGTLGSCQNHGVAAVSSCCTCSAPTATINGGKETRKLWCGSNSVLAAGSRGRWRERTLADPLPYDAYKCPFVDNRYNCLEQIDTSTKYVWEPEMAPQDCAVPNVVEAVDILSRLARMNGSPRRLLICGDSHGKQIYETLLCLLLPRIMRVSAFNHTNFEHWYERGALPRHCRGQWEQRHYWPVEKLCGPRPTEATCEIMRPSYCDLTAHEQPHAMFSRAFFDFGLEVYMTSLRGLGKHLMRGEGSSQQCYDLGLKSLRADNDEADINFDVVLINTFINTEVIPGFLKRRGFRGQLIIVPKYAMGRHGVAKPQVTQPEEQHAKNHAWMWFRFDKMLKKRNADAKAQMYPLWYESNTTLPEAGDIPRWRPLNSTTKHICQLNLNDKRGICASHPNWHAYTTAAKVSGIKGIGESHFCMPGPLDDVSRLILATLVSRHNYYA